MIELDSIGHTNYVVFMVPFWPSAYKLPKQSKQKKEVDCLNRNWKTASNDKKKQEEKKNTIKIERKMQTCGVILSKNKFGSPIGIGFSYFYPLWKRTHCPFQIANKINQKSVCEKKNTHNTQKYRENPFYRLVLLDLKFPLQIWRLILLIGCMRQCIIDDISISIGIFVNDKHQLVFFIFTVQRRFHSRFQFLSTSFQHRLCLTWWPNLASKHLKPVNTR